MTSISTTEKTTYNMHIKWFGAVVLIGEGEVLVFLLHEWIGILICGSGKWD